MAVFFKISVDGRLVYVAKTLISNVITEEEFEKKANAMSIEEILLRFPAKVSAELKMGIKRVNEIKNMKDV